MKEQRNRYTLNSYHRGMQAEDCEGTPLRILTIDSGIEHYPMIAIDGTQTMSVTCEGGLCYDETLSDHLYIYERLMTLEQMVVKWANDKGIMDNSTLECQIVKLSDEVDELSDEIAVDDQDAARMELGDVLVVSTILADMLGTTTETCLQLAYDKIIKRTGKMINGVFVKDE